MSSGDKILYENYSEGEWSPKSKFLNKDVLLIAPGLSVDLHKKVIIKFIEKYSPIVVALNNLQNVEDSYIDYRIACHPIRIISDLSKYKYFKQPLIAPKGQLKNLSKVPLKFPILDFAINVKENIFTFKEKSCIIPVPLVMAYALAMLNSGKSKKIYCVGFDGYSNGDPRQKEVNLVWESYFNTPSFIEVVSLTNTLYEIPKRSIYSFF